MRNFRSGRRRWRDVWYKLKYDVEDIDEETKGKLEVSYLTCHRL